MANTLSSPVFLPGFQLIVPHTCAITATAPVANNSEQRKAIIR